MRLRDLENWLTPAEAGKVIGISKQAIVKRLKEVTLRGVKTHQGWLVDPNDVAKVAEERRQRMVVKLEEDHG
jgi:DNA-binding Lrp family transcriptional regulator